jgi:hypothetical protein
MCSNVWFGSRLKILILSGGSGYAPDFGAVNKTAVLLGRRISYRDRRGIPAAYTGSHLSQPEMSLPAG